MIGAVRLSMTLFLTAAALLVYLPVQAVANAIGGPNAGAPAMWLYRFVLTLISVRVTVRGAPAAERPLLLLPNHISWLDILVLASLAPVSFIAKREVADWPIIGPMARMQRAVFVDRERRQQTGQVAEEVAGRLARGDIIVLFAEGTSSDGNSVLPFRSALIGAAHKALNIDNKATVQPVALAYTRVHGLPLGRQHRARVAWFGDMELAPHLRAILSSGAIDVEVLFGPPLELTGQSDRKAVARQAGAFVKTAVARLNAGHDPAALPPATGGSV